MFRLLGWLGKFEEYFRRRGVFHEKQSEGHLAN